MDITLVVMAAGLGSRFGGLKQMTPVTANGRFLLDFSVYDAVKTGFNKVVFVIRKDFEEDFRQIVGNRIAEKVKVRYVLQNTSILPQGRAKPFGTAHAILCCKDVIDGPFAIVNADDYYGANAFVDIYRHLTNAADGQYAMVAYKMGNTVSENGSVTRGVCQVENDKLVKIVETKGINADCYSQDSGEQYSPDTLVSMNLWGLTRNIFPYLQAKFDSFLQTADLSKDEFLIPDVIFDAVREGYATVCAYTNHDKWYGITHRDDLDKVRKELQDYIDKGLYEHM